MNEELIRTLEKEMATMKFMLYSLFNFDKDITKQLNLNIEFNDIKEWEEECGESAEKFLEEHKDD